MRTDEDTSVVTDLTAPGEIDGDPAQGGDADTESQEVADAATTSAPAVVPVAEEVSDDEPKGPTPAEVTAVHEVGETSDGATSDLNEFVERSEEAADGDQTAEEDADAEIVVPEAEPDASPPTPCRQLRPAAVERTAEATRPSRRQRLGRRPSRRQRLRPRRPSRRPRPTSPHASP